MTVIKRASAHPGRGASRPVLGVLAAPTAHVVGGGGGIADEFIIVGLLVAIFVGLVAWGAMPRLVERFRRPASLPGEDEAFDEGDVNDKD